MAKTKRKRNYNQIVSWEERCEELEEYKREKGNCRVPKRYKANPKFGKWVEMGGYTASSIQER